MRGKKGEQKKLVSGSKIYSYNKKSILPLMEVMNTLYYLLTHNFSSLFISNKRFSSGFFCGTFHIIGAVDILSIHKLNRVSIQKVMYLENCFAIDYFFKMILICRIYLELGPNQ